MSKKAKRQGRDVIAAAAATTAVNAIVQRVAALTTPPAPPPAPPAPPPPPSAWEQHRALASNPAAQAIFALDHHGELIAEHRARGGR